MLPLHTLDTIITPLLLGYIAIAKLLPAPDGQPLPPASCWGQLMMPVDCRLRYALAYNISPRFTLMPFSPHWLATPRLSWLPSCCFRYDADGLLADYWRFRYFFPPLLRQHAADTPPGWLFAERQRHCYACHYISCRWRYRLHTWCRHYCWYATRRRAISYMTIAGYAAERRHYAYAATLLPLMIFSSPPLLIYAAAITRPPLLISFRSAAWYWLGHYFAAIARHHGRHAAVNMLITLMPAIATALLISFLRARPASWSPLLRCFRRFRW